MHFTKATAVIAGLAAHPVVATFGYGGWGGNSYYTTPDNTDNKCSSDQAKGYDWSGLATGSFGSYGSNNFANWSCTNSFGKRDLLTKRTFQSKCISSNLDDEPSIGCNGDASMSIDKYEVSSSEDADIECHYEMPDQTVCKEYHSCSAGGSIIQNTQCGGAKSVTFKPADSFKGKGCSIGVHSIGFNCGTASSTAPAYSKTESVPAYSSSSPPLYSTTSSESSATSLSTTSATQITTDTTPLSSASSTPTIPSYGSSTETAPSYETTTEGTSSSSVATVSSSSQDTTSTCLAGYGSSCASSSSTEVLPSSSESSPVETSIPEYSATTQSLTTSSNSEGSPVTGTTTSSTSSSTGYIPAFPSYSTGGNVPSYNTSLVYSIPAYTRSSSAISDVTSAGSSSTFATSTIYSSAIQTVSSSGSVATFTNTYAVSTTVGQITPSDVSSSPVETTVSTMPSYSGPQPTSPALLPRCINTWLYLTGCSSNSDSSCYCKHEDFINKVYGCLSAWSQSSDNATNGVSYLMGLCAPYIAENPAIVTACPSTITPAAYTPPATSASPSAVPTSSLAPTYSASSTGAEIATTPVGFTSTEASPENTSPSTPASVPCTTITYSSQLTVPATYATGQSQGYTIPSSSITTAIVTTITVPQVQITTYTVTESGTTVTTPGLGYGAPSVPAATTPTAAPATSSQAIPIYGSSGLSTSFSSALPSGFVPYEGDGVRKSAGLISLGVCALAGMMLL